MTQQEAEKIVYGARETGPQFDDVVQVYEVLAAEIRKRIGK